MWLQIRAFWIVITVASAWVWAGGCARVVPPTGGDKDSIAPSLVRSIPAVGSLLVRTQEVRLEFDEDINLNQLNQQLIISPLQDNPYTYKQKRRRLTLTFKKPFPDSSTIFLNFRKGVVDLTEKNPAKDLRISFATGKALDTLMVSGRVILLLDSKPVVGASVGLWPDVDTLSIRKHKPQYLTLTQEDGSFRLESVKAGRYRLVAFLDANGNAIWNGKNELMGFAPDILDVQKDTSVTLRIARIDEEKPRVERTQAAPKAQAEFRFTEGLANLNVYLGKDSLPRQPTDATAATFRAYLPQVWKDTLQIRLVATDSANNVRDTLVPLAPFRIPRDAKPDTGKPTPLGISQVAEPLGGYFLPTYVSYALPEPFSFSAPEPSFRLQADSQKILKDMPMKLNRYRNQLTGYLPFAQLKSYKIYTPSGLVYTTGTPMRVDTLTLKPFTDEQVGVLRGSVGNKAPHNILEVLTDRGIVVKTLYDVKNFELTGLPPGSYVLRLTLDDNGNRRLDLPRYSVLYSGERVLQPTEPTILKANWEVEVGELFTDTP